MNIIMLGSPGAGKGTQAQNIVNKFNLNQISTGDLLRNEIKNKTNIGREIEKIISKGDLATDEIVDRLLKKEIISANIRNNIIFDGYPRNINQAENLELILNSDNQSINYILFLKVPRDIIEKRILERITCEICNKSYNEFIDKKEIANHKCGSKYLIKRKDDNNEAVINRYDEYMKKTKLVLDYYSSRNNFYEIDGSDEIEVISSKIEQILRG
ncbi:MAG TPA: adenylate kinase [Candidatus Pelagibacter bacterium]|nr:adenylate kinase [Candidatus Pelagibacter bacterium]